VPSLGEAEGDVDGVPSLGEADGVDDGVGDGEADEVPSLGEADGDADGVADGDDDGVDDGEGDGDDAGIVLNAYPIPATGSPLFCQTSSMEKKIFPLSRSRATPITFPSTAKELP